MFKLIERLFCIRTVYFELIGLSCCPLLQSDNLYSSEFSQWDRDLLRHEIDSREQKSSMHSEGRSDEGEFTSEVSASAKDAAASTPEVIESCSEDESDESASGLEVQSTEANSLDAVPRNYPTLLPCHSCELICESKQLFL